MQLRGVQDQCEGDWVFWMGRSRVVTSSADSPFLPPTFYLRSGGDGRVRISRSNVAVYRRQARVVVHGSVQRRSKIVWERVTARKPGNRTVCPAVCLQYSCGEVTAADSSPADYCGNVLTASCHRVWNGIDKTWNSGDIWLIYSK